MIKVNGNVQKGDVYPVLQQSAYVTDKAAINKI